MNANITINKHSVGNDFNMRTYWTVANFNQTSEQVFVERLPRWTEETKAYYESLGYTILDVADNGRFAAKYTVKMSKQVHKSHEFKSEYAARKFKRELEKQYA